MAVTDSSNIAMQAIAEHANGEDKEATPEPLVKGDSRVKDSPAEPLVPGIGGGTPQAYSIPPKGASPIGVAAAPAAAAQSLSGGGAHSTPGPAAAVATGQQTTAQGWGEGTDDVDFIQSYEVLQVCVPRLLASSKSFPVKCCTRRKHASAKCRTFEELQYLLPGDFRKRSTLTVRYPFNAVGDQACRGNDGKKYWEREGSVGRAT